MRNRYVYGPVHSWRSGTSLGIDPIGDVSTCSFNCVYCQLGDIQKVTNEIKDYVDSKQVIKDLEELEELGVFSYQDLDVITFAGSGEPTIAANLDEMILGIKEELKKREANVPVSILTNATMFNDKEVIKKASLADQISVKLDAPNEKLLKAINQPAEGITLETIVQGIKKLKSQYTGKLQIQMMFMPKYLKQDGYLEDIAKLVAETGIEELQINTPTRPKPLGKEYHIETRGNHPGDNKGSVKQEEDYETVELPVISEEEAFAIEDRIKDLTKDQIPNLKIINVYKRNK